MNARNLALVTLISALACMHLTRADAYQLPSAYPKRANYFLSWDLSEDQARALAKWDIVILDMEHEVRNPDKIRLMRTLHPGIIILAYITSQEIRNDTATLRDLTPLRYELSQQIPDAWALRRPDGTHISSWQGVTTLNITTLAPQMNGERWYDTLAHFITNRILGSGLWDGVFLDNTWNNLTDHVGAPIDIDNDGIADSPDTIDRAYGDGYDALINEIRSSTGNQYLIVGNDGDRFVNFNGMMFENFPRARGWSVTMKNYRDFASRAHAPSLTILNANTNNTGDAAAYQTMRYGLASALLGDGFYSFDSGDQNHGQTWWYDEYAAALGEPVTAPYFVKTGTTDFSLRGLWRRDYTQGVVLVNSGDTLASLDLNADFEKIKGDQDAHVNDGSIASSVSVPPQDGILLLRPLQELVGAPYVNGAFARVYHADGSRARNGFFSYDDAYLGGQIIAKRDLRRDGALETLVIDHNRAVISRDQHTLASFYPFGSEWRGELSVAIVDAGDTDGLTLVFGQKTRGGKVTATSWKGAPRMAPLYAFSRRYQGGVNVAAGHMNAPERTEIAVGAASGSTLVRVFSLQGKLLSGGWYAFGRHDASGVSVALGNVEGQGKDELVAGRSRGRPDVAIFDARGRQRNRFIAGSAKSTAGIDVTSLALNNDAMDEIIALSRSCYFCTTR